MERNVKIILGVLLLVLFLLAWAPWIESKALHDQVLQEKGEIDGTINKETGELICDYSVMWLPFGRYVASCEGGYFVTFYGRTL